MAGDVIRSIMVWTVYNKPSDYPDNVVARLWLFRDGGVVQPTHALIVGDTLDAVRRRIPSTFTRVERFDDDDPTIVEAWIES